MSAWLLPREHLSASQMRAVELAADWHIVIAGGTGSGKTQVILHRAKYLAKKLGVPPERFRVVVFASTLRRYLRAACPLIDLPPECVVTFRDLCIEYYKAHINKNMSRVSYGIGTMPRMDFWGTRPDVESHAFRSLAPTYDFLVVDEGQDLDLNAFYLFRALARHITVTIDHRQQIYPGRASETEILAALELHERSMTLPGCYRCSSHIMKLAAAVLEDPTDRQEFLSHSRAATQDRETPLIHFADPFNYTDHLACTIRERQLAGDSIGVIVPAQRHLHKVARNLWHKGIDIETGENWDFTSARPKLLTYHGCKGITFDTVCLPYLEDAPIWDPLIDDFPRFLFLAITRATRWVYISSKRFFPLPIVESLLPLEKDGILTVQDFIKRPIKKPEPPKENPLDFL